MRDRPGLDLDALDARGRRRAFVLGAHQARAANAAPAPTSSPPSTARRSRRVGRLVSVMMDRARSATRLATSGRRCQGPDLTAVCGAAEGVRRRAGGSGCALLEQLDELVGHGAGELGRVGDGDGAAVVARHVVADADGDQLDRTSASRSPRSPGAGAAPGSSRCSPTAWNRRPARRPRSSSGCAGAPGRASRRRCAQASASPSMFSFSRPSRIISASERLARRQGASAGL